jgi:hypothetical protein
VPVVVGEAVAEGDVLGELDADSDADGGVDAGDWASLPEDVDLQPTAARTVAVSTLATTPGLMTPHVSC